MVTSSRWTLCRADESCHFRTAAIFFNFDREVRITDFQVSSRLDRQERAFFFFFFFATVGCTAPNTHPCFTHKSTHTRCGGSPRKYCTASRLCIALWPAICKATVAAAFGSTSRGEWFLLARSVDDTHVLCCALTHSSSSRFKPQAQLPYDVSFADLSVLLQTVNAESCSASTRTLLCRAYFISAVASGDFDKRRRLRDCCVMRWGFATTDAV